MPDILDQHPITLNIDAELSGSMLKAQIVRLDLSEPTASILPSGGNYLIDMCLTPRPVVAKGNYRTHWGPHRYERLGDIYIVPPGEELFVRGGTVQQAALMCELSAKAVHDVLGQPLSWGEQRLVSALDINSARIRALLLRLTDEVRHPGFASQRLFEYISGELAVEIGRYCLEQSELPVAGGLAGWRLRLIDERLNDDLHAPTLKELAELCGMSVRQLTRGFRVSRGSTIGDYLEQRRMEAAKRKLMKGDAVKSVAFELGFTSPSSFTFAFRRAVGTSPTQFRQRQARGITSRAE